MPGLPFAGRVAAAWREHEHYLAAAEELRVQQEAMARGGGFHVEEPDEADAAAAAAVKRSALEEAAAASHHETIVQRVYRAVTTFDAAELRDMLNDFASDHAANVNVAAGSLASAGVVGATVWKARCVGRLYDSLTGGDGGGLSALLSGAGAAKLATVAAASPLPPDSAHVWWSHGALLLAVLGASLAEWALSVARDYSFGRARAARVVASRRRYLAAMLSQDMTFHAANNSAVLAQRLQSDPEALDDAAIYSLERLLRGVIALITAAAMIRADWPTFTLGLALRLPFALQFVEKSVAIVTAYERLQAHTLQRAQARAAEALGAVSAIQVHTAEDVEVEGYARLLAEHAAVTRRGAVAQAVLRQTEHLVVALSEFITLAFGAWRIYSGAMSLGAFTAYRSHMQVVIDEFNRWEFLYVGLRQAAIQSRKYYALLRRVPSLGGTNGGGGQLSPFSGTGGDSAGSPGSPSPASSPSAASSLSASARSELPAVTAADDGDDGAPAPASSGGLRHRRRGGVGSGGGTAEGGTATAAAPPPLQLPTELTATASLPATFSGHLRFEGVTFAYPLPPGAARRRGAAATTVLRDVSFDAAPGRVIALVGPSGSGKSTVARLCLRFYDPTAGRVTLDGVDVRALPLRALRRCVGLVEQDSSLLDRSVRDNLTLGLDDPAGVTDERLHAAARAAHAHDFISALPHGYDTRVGERGSRLSGGQRQRVQIARALLRDSRVLILDEATSALDAENEALVSAALGRLMAGRTVIVVAHKLSTVRRADAILVLQGGRIVEAGSHEAILAAHPAGLYARLLRHQQAGGGGGGGGIDGTTVGEEPR